MSPYQKQQEQSTTRKKMVHHRSGRNYNYSGASKQEFVEINLFSPKSDLKTIKYGVSIDFDKKNDPKKTMMYNHDAKNYKNLTYFQKIKKSMINQDQNPIQMFKKDPMQPLLADQIGSNLAGGSSCDLYQSIDDQSDERKIIFHKVNQDGTTTIIEEPSNDYIVNL